MRFYFFTIMICCSLLYNCNGTNSEEITLGQLIPENSSLILRIKDFDSFNTDIKNNNLFNAIFQNKLDSIIDVLEIVNLKSELFVCFNKTDDLSDVSIIGASDNSVSDLGSNFYHTIIGNYFIASTSKETVKDFELNQNSSFAQFYNINKNNSSFSIYTKDHNLMNAIGYSLLDNEKVNLFSRNMWINTTVFPEEIRFNGISLTKDSIHTLLDVFNKTTPQENNIPQITPVNSDGFLSITFEDFSSLHKNLIQYQNLNIDSVSLAPVLETVNEIGNIFLDGESAVILKSLDSETTRDALLEFQEELDIYRNIPIYKFDESNISSKTLNPLIKLNSISKYTILNDFFVFSDSESILRKIISNHQNQTVLSRSQNYKVIKENLSNASSLLIYTNSEKLENNVTQYFKESVNTSLLKIYKSNAFQFIADDGFIHINGILKKEKQTSHLNSINEEFNINIDTNILNDPHFVINHITKEKEIVAQDVNNELYLITNKGKILWKKRIDGNIIGQIQQVDLYKNGRLQLAFTTSNKLYVVDRNGNDVLPFPLRFNDKITQPLSIFDYDNRKNYRFLITQGNELLMYDKKGKRVNGFKYRPTHNIITQPKHFKIRGKDYIVFVAENIMKILSRQGKDRIIVNESIDFSGNPIYRYRDKFTTTSSSGMLIQVNLKGNVSQQVLNLQDNHNIESTNKTLVTLSDNVLTVKQKSIELDFGNYTSPKLFYLNDKIYVSVTDLQTQKIYLYDSEAKLIANFPVYGSSKIDMNNIDNDSNLEFVTKGGENSIILYQKN